LETNLFGPLAVTSAFANRLAERSGVVINVASIVSWISLAGTYGVSKAALWSATDSMRVELGPRGVQVVGLYVAYVDTDMSAGADVAKSDPADVVRQVLDGVEACAVEILADDLTRAVRASLGQPVQERFAQFLPSRS
jgi:NAD(P)-dependent dehydrogenase (short-subunit alcohol dehydrogenase family)